MADRPVKVFICAAEVSGDHHAARLMRQFARDGKQVSWTGLGGPAIKSAGAVMLDDLVSRSAMLINALGQVAYYWQLLGRVKQHLIAEKPDLVITVDSPAWNIHIAKVAQKLGIPVMQYVAPQLWAWAPWRAGKWRKNADAIACILPFEPEWFARKGIKAEFVGHPIFDDRSEYIPSAESVERDRAVRVVALLPGSRKQEIARLWPAMFRIAREMQRGNNDLKFITAAPDESTAAVLRAAIPADLDIEICTGGLVEATTRAQLAIIASGTATLETAVVGCPMIVIYHVPNWQWQMVGRHILTVSHISLVNILAGKELVPEYVPFNNRAEQVARRAMELLDSPARLARLRQELIELTRPLAQNKASENVAAMAYKMLAESSNKR
ncbi:MAG: lipid-A-disaccharide synthase [Sedimentisphaerales bacterium]|nr:lipid-A-disaccharide synthase [Sedimentisphaerales bacterium]MBN2843970.1 lipid-A-disaccharide synthase [Sedimentisphaerales bacterium]